MSVKLEHIEILDNGIVHYDSGTKNYPKEEVEKINKEYFDNCKKWTEEAKQDGYIEFPIMYENGLNDIQWSCCWLPPNFEPSCAEGFEERHGRKHNIYIPSYKRAGFTYTDKMLERFGIDDYYFCVDPDQYQDYKNEYGIEKVIIRDPTFKLESKLNQVGSMSVPYNLAGGASFVNAMIYMGKALGETHIGIMDDDLFSMGLKGVKKSSIENTKQPGYKYNKDDFIRASSLRPEFFNFKEWWADVEKIFLSARNRSAIASEKFGLVFQVPVSVKLGTRSYTQYLIRTDLPYPEQGKFNNDILASLTFNKAGYVNMIFEGFQYDSLDSQKPITKKDEKTGEIKVNTDGGCTAAYQSFGTLDKSKCLVTAHPATCKIAYMYNRIHHRTNFSTTSKRLVGEAIGK